MPIPLQPSVSKRLRDELKRLRREGRTTVELSVTDRNPNINEPVDFTVRLWHFDPLYIWLPLQGVKVAIRRNDMSGAPTKIDVLTDSNGEATVTETYADPTDLTYYTEYTPPRKSPFMGSSCNTVDKGAGQDDVSLRMANE